MSGRLRSRIKTQKYSRGFPLPAFQLNPIVSGTIIADRGSVSPTFTRATTATITDQDLVVRQVLSGEARFGGFRRVQNLAGSNSENLTQGTWVGAGALPTTVNSATTMTFGAQFQNLGKQINTVSGNTYRFTFDVRWISGNTALHFVYNNGGTFTALTITPTTQRVSVLFTSTFTGADRIGLQDRNAAGFGQVYYTRYQVEDVTGQSNQNPAEYVSVGVLSAPYQGANVDGVQYFPYLNGNTAASNVVTEARGAAISSSILGGYLAEPAATNSAIQSEDQSTSWTVNSTTVTTNNLVAPNGLTTMDTITASAAASAHFNFQNFTFTASTYTLSFYVRYTGLNRWIAIRIFDGTTSFIGSFDLLNGAVGALTANTVSSITPAGTNLYRVTIATTVAVAAAAGNIAICLNNADSATFISWTPAGTETVGVWGADLKLGNLVGLINSYIPTTTVAVTRNADVLTYATTGWLNAAAGTLYAEWFNPTNGGTFVIASINNGGGNDRINVYSNTTTTGGQDVLVAGATQSALSAVSITGGAIAKIITMYQVNDFAGYANNTTLGTDATGTVPTVTALNIGNTIGSNYLGHYVRKVAYYNSRLASAQARSLTV